MVGNQMFGQGSVDQAISKVTWSTDGTDAKVSTTEAGGRYTSQGELTITMTDEFGKPIDLLDSIDIKFQLY